MDWDGILGRRLLCFLRSERAGVGSRDWLVTLFSKFRCDYLPPFQTGTQQSIRRNAFLLFKLAFFKEQYCRETVHLSLLGYFFYCTARAKTRRK